MVGSWELRTANLGSCEGEGSRRETVEKREGWAGLGLASTLALAGLGWGGASEIGKSGHSLLTCMAMGPKANQRLRRQTATNRDASR